MSSAPSTSPRPAAFFDRDGVLNIDHGYVHSTDRLELVEGAAAALAACHAAGFLVFVVTNQSGIARGMFDEPALQTFHDDLRALLTEQGGVIDDIRYCPHLEDATLRAYRRACDWRKPGPGMILDLAKSWDVDLARSFLIGDKPSDMAAAEAAGVRGFLFEDGDLAGFVATTLSELTASAPPERSKGMTMPDMPYRVRRWLTDAALPLWSGVGVDADQGGFVERLTLAGMPDLAAPKRVRVQARQIYVFSHAKLVGLMPDGDAIAAQGHDFVMRHGFPDGIARGVVHAFERDGRVRDAKRDTYDHAFLLFALSWFYRATGRADVRADVLALGDAIWALLRHPGGHGFVVDDQGGDALHQNPHMHLFEAVLAAYDATGEDVFLIRARELFELFRTRMFDARLGVLREFYDADWQPAAGEAGRIVEPGHHEEWVWLLQWYATRAGQPLGEEAVRLFDFAARHGRPAGGALLCDELWTDGSVKRTSTRSWPQTEAIKAEIAIAESRGEPLGEPVDAIVAALFDTFLDRPVRGAWIDWVDESGMPLVQAIPASTFYHVFLAFTEYLRAKSA